MLCTMFFDWGSMEPKGFASGAVEEFRQTATGQQKIKLPPKSNGG